MKQDSIIKDKPLLTQSRLFLEVSSVIGKVAALEELTKAYREYSKPPVEGGSGWDWDKYLIGAFIWEYTPQGRDFWDSIDEDVEENVK